jgi:hypothetical protein
MSTATFPNMISRSNKHQTDAQKFAEFKAKKLAEKEAAKEKLAAEFPLLFGKDAKARNTVGKYANKPAPAPTTTTTAPAKGKKPLSTATTPVRQVPGDGKRTPGKANAKHGNQQSKKGIVSTGLIVNNENKDSNIPQQQNTKGLTKKSSSSKGFFQYFQSSKSTKEECAVSSGSSAVVNETTDVPQITVPPLTSLSRSCSADKEDDNDDDYSNAIELSVMNENHFFSTVESTHNSLLHSENLLDLIESGTTTLDSVSQDDSVHPHIDLPSDNNERESCMQPCLEVLSVKEKVQDALDFMLESNEVDSKTYRRLSGQRFSTEALRRFSRTVTPLPHVSSVKRLSISNNIDFRVISQDSNDLNEDETIGNDKENNSDSDTDGDDDDDNAMDAVILTNPYPTPIKQRERISIEEWRLSTASLHPQSGEKTGVSSLPVSPLPVEASAPSASKEEPVSSSEAVVDSNVPSSVSEVPSSTNGINDNDIGDLEVLYALRNYISTLEECTYFNNPMRNNKVIKNHSRMKDKRVTCIIDKPLTAEEQQQAKVETNKTEEKQEAEGEPKTASSESSVEDGSCSAEIKPTAAVQYYPRQTLFEEIMKAGCLNGEIISFIKYENHVKYIIDFQVSELALTCHCFSFLILSSP